MWQERLRKVFDVSKLFGYGVQSPAADRDVNVRRLRVLMKARNPQKRFDVQCPFYYAYRRSNGFANSLIFLRWIIAGAIKRTRFWRYDDVNNFFLLLLPACRI